MQTLDHHIVELRQLMEQIFHQFRTVEVSAVEGPLEGLSIQELRVVELLGDKGSKMMREIGEFLFLAVNSVTSLIDGLEKNEIVARTRFHEDRRVVQVELTEKGRVAYDSLLRMKGLLHRRMLSALTEEEREIFMVLMRKIARITQAA